MTSRPVIRDFIYLDVPRLQSFASQLLEGLPEAETKIRGHEADFAGEVRAGLPGFLGATANTKAVLSASSSVTSTVHHRLVGLVIDELISQGFMASVDSLDVAPDGAFTLLSGRLQVTDPSALRAIFEDWGTLMKQIAALQAGPEAQPVHPLTMADRRAGRTAARVAAQTVPISKAYSDALAGVIRKLAEDAVRIRVLDGEVTLALCIAEREKFVEDVGRLTTRHGFLMSGNWEILGQVNGSVDTDPVLSDGQRNLMDIVESASIPVLKTMTDASGTGDTGEGIRLTPLAIYRKITAEPAPGAQS